MAPIGHQNNVKTEAAVKDSCCAVDVSGAQNAKVSDKELANALCASPTNVELSRSVLWQLSNACSSNSVEIAERLLKIDCPIYVAVLLQNVEVTAYMLGGGSSIDSKDPTTGRTALHVAVENVDLAHVKKLIHLGANVHAEDASGKTPLAMLRYPYKALPILKILLGKKARLTTCDNDGFMQMRSVLQNGWQEAVELVLNSSDVSATDQNSQNVVHYLAANRDGELMETLSMNCTMSMKKFDVDARDIAGLTPLHCAVRAGNKYFVEYAIKHGANVNLVSNDGDSAFIQAVKFTSESTLEHRVECVKVLLKNNARPDMMMGQYFKIYNAKSAIDRDFALLEPVIAVLAVWKTAGKPFNRDVLDKIESHPKLEKYFEACTRELETMKRKKFYEPVDVFKVLADYDSDKSSVLSKIAVLCGGLWLDPVLDKYSSVPIYRDLIDNRVSKMIGRTAVVAFFIIAICFFTMIALFLWKEHCSGRYTNMYWRQ